MGLDMYLRRKTSIVHNLCHDAGYHSRDGGEKCKCALSVNGPPGLGQFIKKSRLWAVTEDVLYWRKANAIHSWFVHNVQSGVDDCGNYSVTGEQLSELLSVCQQVKKEPKLAQELLPTAAGFFFGGLQYDEYYFDDIKRTIKELKALLKEHKAFAHFLKPVEQSFDIGYEYHASW